MKDSGAQIYGHWLCWEGRAQEDEFKPGNLPQYQK
jgi:hypothetical protein